MIKTNIILGIAEEINNIIADFSSKEYNNIDDIIYHFDKRYEEIETIKIPNYLEDGIVVTTGMHGFLIKENAIYENAIETIILMIEDGIEYNYKHEYFNNENYVIWDNIEDFEY